MRHLAKLLPYTAGTLLGAWLAVSLYPQPGIAASRGDQVAGPYRRGTVRISGPGGDGFGFIVGEKGGRLYLVTANHVVSGPVGKVQLYFEHDRIEPVSAEVLVRSIFLDAAVLKVPKPSGLDWTPKTYCPSNVDAPAFERGEKVWFMRLGRGRKWQPALDNEAGEMRDSEPDPTDRMAFSGIGVRPGVSGSPLIAQRGIVGMVIQDRANEGVAVDIEKLRRLVRHSGAPWGLPRCGETAADQAPVMLAPPRTPETPRTASPCWDDWTHKKVCRDPMKSGGEGPEMVLLSGGMFKMGSEGEEADSDEKPVHDVTVAPFALAKYEVTNGEFARFAKAKGYKTEAEEGDGCYGWTGKTWERKKEFNWKNVGFEQEDDHPVVCVSWNDANAYLEWLSGETGEKYQLPTEAEWEYAARGGSQDERFWGDDSAKACAFANVADKSAKGKWRAGSIHDCDDGFGFTAPMGSFKPNGFGLYDLLGNVWEWTCSEYANPFDGSESKCISNNRATGPRVLRGGSWDFGPVWVRSADRSRFVPGFRYGHLGFRPARIL